MLSFSRSWLIVCIGVSLLQPHAKAQQVAPELAPELTQDIPQDEAKRATQAEIEVTGFFVVDIVAGVSVPLLQDGTKPDTIDIASGTPLSIRVDVTNPMNEAVVVELDLDNSDVVRRESLPPYYLGGELDGVPSEVIFELGPHTLTATVLRSGMEMDEVVDQQTIVFRVIDSTMDQSPTVTPVAKDDKGGYEYGFDGMLNGELRQWHKITIGFGGQPTAERNNIVNPFADLRLDVQFVHASTQTTLTVPGFYATDANAANTGAFAGSAWLVHFRPPLTGSWSYTASFRQGPGVAWGNSTDTAASASFFDGAQGTFQVEESNKVAPDLRAKGRLEYVGERYLKFAGTSEYFIKAGADSPENFLAYDDFDNTPDSRGLRKSWAAHEIDFVEGVDPTWAGGKGRGIIGAVNYLSSVGMNVFSFIPMNIEGDDKNVFPYTSNEPEDFDRFDVSKLAQWEVVFDHAETKGMFLHFKTQETENDQLLDGGELGPYRKLYYRELIARFGHHLAIQWNLGEQNTNTAAQIKAFADYIKELDPYKSPIVMHAQSHGVHNLRYAPLLGYPTFDGVSMRNNPKTSFARTLDWLERSRASGKQWIVAHDEQTPAGDGVVPDSVDPDHDFIRIQSLWGNLMAGGWGVEYYFGYDHPNSDLTCEDFRSRANMWEQSRYALDFFYSYVPFWNMANANELVTKGNHMLLEAGDSPTIVLYLPTGNATVTVDLSGLKAGSTYTVSWYDPRNGGDLQTGTVDSVVAGETVTSIGKAPNSPNSDWAILLS